MKKGLSLDDHKKYGKILKKMYLNSSELFVAYQHAYPKNKRINQQLRKLRDSIIQAKSEGENELFADYPNLENVEGLNIYYGPLKEDE